MLCRLVGESIHRGKKNNDLLSPERITVSLRKGKRTGAIPIATRKAGSFSGDPNERYVPALRVRVSDEDKKSEGQRTD